MCIRLCAVILQLRIVHNDDAVRAVSGELVGQTLYIGSDQNGGNGFLVQIIGEISCFTQKLKCDVADLVVNLLSKDKYTFVIL